MAEKRQMGIAMQRNQFRNWQFGDVYTYKDLTPGEQFKWKQRVKPTKDVFDILNINPLSEWKVCNNLA